MLAFRGCATACCAEGTANTCAAFHRLSFSPPSIPLSSIPSPVKLGADIAAQLQCLSPWLDSLPDPQLLSADLLAVNASIDGTLRPRLTDLSTQLASLAGALEPGAGRYALALEIAGNVSALLLEGPAGLVPRANVREGSDVGMRRWEAVCYCVTSRGCKRPSPPTAHPPHPNTPQPRLPSPQAFMAAAGALDASAEEPAKMAAVLGALGALLPLDEAMADLAGLQDALATLHAAGTTDGYVPAAVDDLAALRGMAVDVLAITGTVRALQVGRGQCLDAGAALLLAVQIPVAFCYCCLPLPPSSHSPNSSPLLPGQPHRSGALHGGAAGAGSSHQRVSAGPGVDVRWGPGSQAGAAAGGAGGGCIAQIIARS